MPLGIDIRIVMIKYFRQRREIAVFNILLNLSIFLKCQLPVKLYDTRK
jgi:hypothetical protein